MNTFRQQVGLFNQKVDSSSWALIKDAYEEPTPGYSSYNLVPDNTGTAIANIPIRSDLTLPVRVQAYQAIYTPEEAIKETPDALTVKHTFRTQAEREMVDMAAPGAGPLRLPHLNLNDQTPRHLRLEEIARRTAKTISVNSFIDDADTRLQQTKALIQIRDFLKAIEADDKVADTFFALLRRKEDATDEEKHERQQWRSLWRAAQAGELETLAPDPPRLQWPSEPEPPTHWPTWKEGQAFMQEWKAWKESLDDHDPVVGEEPDDARIDGHLFKYHPVPTNDPKTDWLRAQPKWYRALIQFVKAANPQQIKELAKLAYQNTWAKYLELAHTHHITDREVSLLRFLVNDRSTPGLTPGDGQLRWRFKVNQHAIEKVRQFMADYLPPFSTRQADVFWSYWKLRKAQHAPVLNRAARQVKQRIETTKSLPQLKWVGAKMIQLQRGDIGSPSCFPTNREWEILWDIYHVRRKQLAPQISLPSDKCERVGSEQRA